jgi:protein farnesyltransferase/geranylgeranyltransferase type-1 subunit alpha
MKVSDWEGITPIPQLDGPNPVVPISYSPECNCFFNWYFCIISLSLDTNLTSLFRGAQQCNEKSERVLRLTELILNLNPGHYTVWWFYAIFTSVVANSTLRQYRRECISFMNYDLDVELDFVDRFSETNSKNYQIWYHRRRIVEMMGSPTREFQFCNQIFAVDGKNYHAWAHRQWIVQKFSRSEAFKIDLHEEFKWIEHLFDHDLRNNSAWNYRWFLLHLSSSNLENDAIISSEFDYVCNKIQLLHFNESSWNYLRGLVNKYPSVLVMKTILFCCFEVTKVKTCTLSEYLMKEIQHDFIYKQISELENNISQNSFALSLFADLLEKEKSVEALQCALILYEKLSVCEYMRVKFWLHRCSQVETKLASFNLV